MLLLLCSFSISLADFDYWLGWVCQNSASEIPVFLELIFSRAALQLLLSN